MAEPDSTELTGIGEQGHPSAGPRTPVYLICSPQSRVGKTLAARLLLDFYLSDEKPALGFDTNPFDPGLAAIFPAQTTVVELTTARGQMTLFDSLVQADGRPKVVDVWHAFYELVLRQAAELDFFEEARRRGVVPIAVLQTDSAGKFGAEIKRLTASWPDMLVFLVYNKARTRADDYYRTQEVSFATNVLVLPEIDAVMMRLLEQPNMLAWRLIQNPANDTSLVVQVRMRELLGPFFRNLYTSEQKFQLYDAGST